VIKKHFRPNGLPTVVIAFLSAIALRADFTYPPPSTGPNSPRLIGAFAADPGLFPIYDYYRPLTNTEIDTVLNLVNYPLQPLQHTSRVSKPTISRPFMEVSSSGLHLTAVRTRWGNTTPRRAPIPPTSG
jgi:hypothetical protein